MPTDSMQWLPCAMGGTRRLPQAIVPGARIEDAERAA
jgi:hypothetical protein